MNRWEVRTDARVHRHPLRNHSAAQKQVGSVSEDMELPHLWLPCRNPSGYLWTCLTTGLSPPHHQEISLIEGNKAEQLYQDTDELNLLFL